VSQSFVAETSYADSINAIGATNGVYEWFHRGIRFAVDVYAQFRPSTQQVFK
jgi:hypothetical protein